MPNENILVPWLNDAYAMESALIQILQSHAKQAEGHPLIAAKLEEHLEQTRNHALSIKGCVERHGHHTSGFKSGAGSLLGALQALATGIFGDALVKNLLADYSAEKFEIISYRALITAASDMGDQQTVEVCQGILVEEEQMARWIEDNLSAVVLETLQQKAAT